MRVLLTGTDGYIGAILGSRLTSEGHDILGVDTGFYREGWLYTDPERSPWMPRALCADIRQITPHHLEGFLEVLSYELTGRTAHVSSQRTSPAEIHFEGRFAG